MSKKSRYIRKKVSDAVKERHFFDCAWCGQNLTERHHIKEWHLGGENTAENLILLCPTCHTLVHQGKISTDELKERKSTHRRGDRISGGFRTSLKDKKFFLGNNFLKNVKHLIALEYQPILSVVEKDGLLLFNVLLYDKDQNLTFWMHNNIYWAPSHFSVHSRKNFLEIYDNNMSLTLLKFFKKPSDDFIHIECDTYLDSSRLSINYDKDVVLKTKRYNVVYSKCGLTNFHIGFWISDVRNLATREEFLRLNNEHTDLRGNAFEIG